MSHEPVRASEIILNMCVKQHHNELTICVYGIPKKSQQWLQIQPIICFRINALDSRFINSIF